MYAERALIDQLENIQIDKGLVGGPKVGKEVILP